MCVCVCVHCCCVALAQWLEPHRLPEGTRVIRRVAEGAGRFQGDISVKGERREECTASACVCVCVWGGGREEMRMLRVELSIRQLALFPPSLVLFSQ